MLCGAVAIPAMNANAAVVQRGTAARPAPSRAGNSSARMPTATIGAKTPAAAPATNTAPATDAAQSDTAPAPQDTPDTTVIIEDKTDQFSNAMAAANTNIASGASDTELAEMIRRQRAALDANDATTTANTQMQNALAAGQSACDTGLRNCMKTKCGSDFTKCSGDGDTDFGMKLDSCRRDLKCTGEEFRLFSAEIKADRDMNARLSAYNKILDCGNRYNDCIASECGITYSKCLGKTAGDAAIAACAQIARECTQQDSGMANRTMQVFATLRQAAEVQVKKDEQRLYELRDKMADACHALGAMFDERSLDCVFTVNFFAANSTTPYASKKAYAGDTFDCNQNWFGIDITTFKENAYRLTREQKSATSAMLGSGVGMAAGAITSGAIDRAIDRHKADRALKKAEKEHEENYGDKKDNKKKEAKKEAKKEDTTDSNSAETSANTDDGTNAQNPDTENNTAPENDQTDTKQTGEQNGNTESDGSNADTSTTGETAPAATGTAPATTKTTKSNGSETNNNETKKKIKKQETKTNNKAKVKRRDKKAASAQNSESHEPQGGDDQRTQSGKDKSEQYSQCESKTKMKYAFNAKSQPRYKELYNQEKSRIDSEWDKKLDTPYPAGTNIDGNCNGTHYTCTAGQTPRQCQPQACWDLGKEGGLALEHRIEQEFIKEMITEECAQYK